MQVNFFRNSSGVKRSIRSCNQGFTLIEVAITVVIIGIISSIAAVNWSQFTTHQRLRSNANSLFSEINSLKAQAISNNRPYFVTFNAADDNYTVFKGNNENSTDPSQSATLYQKTLSGGVSFGTAPSGVLSTPLGEDNNWSNAHLEILPQHLNSINTGNVYLTVANTNKGYCIIKKPGLNLIQLYFWNGNAWTLM